MVASARDYQSQTITQKLVNLTPIQLGDLVIRPSQFKATCLLEIFHLKVQSHLARPMTPCCDLDILHVEPLPRRMNRWQPSELTLGDRCQLDRRISPVNDDASLMETLLNVLCNS
jgi:hypothetical protein